MAGMGRTRDMQRTSGYRYISVLLEEGYALRDPQTGRYRAASTWAHPADEQALSVAQIAPAMRRISGQTGDSSFLICQVGSDSLCLPREIGSNSETEERRGGKDGGLRCDFRRGS